MTRPLSSDEIDAEIWRLSQVLDRQVGIVAQRARDAAQADADWKVAHAKAVLQVEGSTVSERDAQALVACEAEYRAHRAADAVLLAAQEAGRSLRSNLEALRTLSASQRAALTYATGVGS